MSTGHYILWTVLKILIIVVLIVAVFAIGAMIGYSVFGGGKGSDVFRPELWNHIRAFFE